MATPLKVYFIIGELSGDELGADLLQSFANGKIEIIPQGLGGSKMSELGLQSLFPINEIAVMGISGVVTKLPSLLAKVRMVAADIIKQKPDIILLIDSPEFSKQVAKRVKNKLPELPIVKYVCPQVWAWRSGRAPKMRSYIDHILAILPFEPELMQKLNGPETTYVGHPLARLCGKVDWKLKRTPSNPSNILLLPGSRKNEIKRLLPILEKSADLLVERGNKVNFTIPAVAHLSNEIREATSKWNTQPNIIVNEEEKIATMQSADSAIASSGTAILELAMYGVPTISIYKLDPALNAIRSIIKAWTAALPNLIADSIIIPERMNEYAHPEYIARLTEQLIRKGPERDTQLNGFKIVHQKLKQIEAPGDIAVNTILKLLSNNPSK